MLFAMFTDLVSSRIIPVIVIRDAERATGLGEALLRGGIPVAEVTFRTDAAAEAVRRMSRLDGLLVGAGTVVNVDQVDAAVDAGARFIVSPGLNAAVVQRAMGHGVPIVPGTVTPSEIMAGLELGLTTLKFFPAELSGGVAALKALASPFSQVRFVPTGGVTPANLPDYLALPNVAAVGGSWMVKESALAAGDFDSIAAECAWAAAAAKA